MIADDGQTATAPSVFAACPTQGRIEVIRAVHKHGAGFDLVSNGFGPHRVLRPQRCGKAEIAVVHESNRLGVGLDGHNADHWPKAFFAHDPHVMGHVGENLRRQIGAAVIFGKGVDMGRGAICNGLSYLATYFVCKAHVRHWAKCCFWVQRIAKLIALHDCHSLFHENVEQAFMHINSFNPAATLTGIEHRAIDQRVHSCINVCILHNIAGVFTPKFQTDPSERASSGGFHRLAATD